MRGRQVQSTVAAGLTAAAAILAIDFDPTARARPGNSGDSTPLSAPKLAARFDGHKLVRTHIRTQEQLDQLMGLGAVPWGCATGVGDGEFLLSPEAAARLASSGIRTEELIGNIQPMI